MNTGTPFQMVQSIIDLDQGFLREIAQQIFLSGAFVLGSDMNDVHVVPVSELGLTLPPDINYTLRQYFPATAYKNPRVRIGRRFPLHRMECEENCLLLTVVLNTSILGHTMYALDPAKADDNAQTRADSVCLNPGDAFIHDRSMWMSFLPESLDNDYIVMIQADCPYTTPEDRDKHLQEAMEIRQKLLSSNQ